MTSNKRVNATNFYVLIDKMTICVLDYQINTELSFINRVACRMMQKRCVGVASVVALHYTLINVYLQHFTCLMSGIENLLDTSALS